MKDSTTLTSGWVSFAVVFVLMGWSVAFPVTAAAQGQGQNAVCTSTTGCSTTVGTNAFIDASM